MSEEYYRCPKCGAMTNTEYYPEVSDKSKFGTLGALGALGALVGGPIGLTAGLTVGKYVNKARSTRWMADYKCNNCGHVFNYLEGKK